MNSSALPTVNESTKRFTTEVVVTYHICEREENTSYVWFQILEQIMNNIAYSHGYGHFCNHFLLWHFNILYVKQVKVFVWREWKTDRKKESGGGVRECGGVSLPVIYHSSFITFYWSQWWRLLFFPMLRRKWPIFPSFSVTPWCGLNGGYISLGANHLVFKLTFNEK
jgi:hypothetical protein